MKGSELRNNRRGFLRGMALGATGLTVSSLFNVRGLFAEQLRQTAAQGEGPFYPDQLPLDTDNDLLTVNDGITPAVGQATHLGGRILDTSGAPIRNALVEIWQADNNGIYLHSNSNDEGKMDENFQGFGRFMTGSTGEYYFRTIKPVIYGNRTAHVHFALKIDGRDTWTTQCYVTGEARNETDNLLNRIRDPRARETVIVDFVPLQGSQIGELSARFDIVLGVTPEA